MKTPFTVIIPARLASTRLPRKPLADIGGKPMIVRVAQRALLSAATHVVVATDSEEILAVCQANQIEAVLTRGDHPTGTDRLGEVAQKLKLEPNAIVVNVQGDEPFIPPSLINEVAECLANHPECAIATAGLPITDASEINNPNAVKIALAKSGQALYFSRAPIPFLRNTDTLIQGNRCVRHIGIYAYRVSFLNEFSKLDPAPIEQAEALEQLRALWHGYHIQVMLTKEAPPAGVDTPEDLVRAQQEWGKIGAY
jgi:3-deoxy-manno-octulosonate cytidylyltransferase (CMP-KDO synthetase)